MLSIGQELEKMENKHTRQQWKQNGSKEQAINASSYDTHAEYNDQKRPLERVLSIRVFKHTGNKNRAGKSVPCWLIWPRTSLKPVCEKHISSPLLDKLKAQKAQVQFCVSAQL